MRAGDCQELHSLKCFGRLHSQDCRSPQYADDYNLIDKFGYQPRWDTWGRLTQSAFATVPLVTGIGA